MTHTNDDNTNQPPTRTITCQQQQQKSTLNSTARMQHLPEHSLSALNERAMRWAQCAKFECALDDAVMIQLIAPLSALGYLCAARVYSEQGKQCDAVDICNKGLDVIDASDPDYQQLQQVKTNAIQRASQRVDFISQLPIDIVLTVLAPMFMNAVILDSTTPCPYLYVSRTWCDRVLKSCRGLTFGIGYGAGCEGESFKQIIRFAQHTRALSVMSCTQGTCLGELLRYGDLCSLKQLHIKSFRLDTVKHFVSSLQTISTTLTHFSINIHRSCRLSLADIVSNCPNLIYLKMIHPYHTDCNALPTTATYPKLKSLYLMQVMYDNTHDRVQGILKRFPSLERLELDRCTDMKSILAIPKQYPWMQHLQLHHDDERMEIKAETMESEHPENGITYLDIHSYEWEEDISHDIVRVLEQHQKTLVDISLKLKGSIHHDKIDTMHYPCLKRLALSYTSEASACFGWWIPNQAPLLQDLRMTVTVIKTHPTILNTKPPHLKRLVMRLGDPDPEEETAIARYINYYAQQGKQSSLKELELHLYTEHFSPIQEAICHLSQLQHLMIGFTCEWVALHVDRFLELLVNGCPYLEFLDMSWNKVLSVESLHILKRLASLKEIVLSINDMHDHHDFWDALGSLPQLKCIRMFPSKASSCSGLLALRDSRPDIKIVVNNYRSQGWG
ncbi:hypothetical protein K492DRAFT_210522 [Lichtheimia hyalospora FSU 10163]|nr:hypothetical protein K492DRAFT_210522 [Lichtheimia hyalospora FSU 10163]